MSAAASALSSAGSSAVSDRRALSSVSRAIASVDSASGVEVTQRRRPTSSSTPGAEPAPSGRLGERLERGHRLVGERQRLGVRPAPRRLLRCGEVALGAGVEIARRRQVPGRARLVDA